MFQTESTEQNKLQNILKEELEYFSTVLQFSEKFVKQVGTLSISVLAKTVNYRQELIYNVLQRDSSYKTL